VSSIGTSGGFFGPSIVGFLKQTTGSDSGAFLGLAGLALGDGRLDRNRPRAHGFNPSKGTNGRWRDVLSAEEIAAADEIAAQNLTPDCAHWLPPSRRSRMSLKGRNPRFRPREASAIQLRTYRNLRDGLRTSRPEKCFSLSVTITHSFVSATAATIISKSFLGFSAAFRHEASPDQSRLLVTKSPP
jgi:hypothetical protein